MPLNLKANKFAQVEPEFIDLLKQIWKTRWMILNNEIKAANPQWRKLKIQDNAPIMSQLKALCTSKPALDKELTRLRGLPYERFYLRHYRNETWLVGLTQPINLTDNLSLWRGPRFFVYIPGKVIDQGLDAHFQFIPEGNEMTLWRHPHHKAKDEFWSDEQMAYVKAVEHARDPLDHAPSTCWGSFGTIVSACINSGDVVDLFRNIQIYLTRVDFSSLLVRPFELCTHFTPFGQAPHKYATCYAGARR